MKAAYSAAMNNTLGANLSFSFYSLADVALRSHISPERLLELCESGFAPHYRVDGGAPMFKLKEIMEWAKENLVRATGGMPLPSAVPVLVADDTLSELPAALRGLSNIRTALVLPKLCGLYFLCKARTVVYVGQSVDVYARLNHHRDQKLFDTAYVWPCPKSELDAMEGAFIRILQPSLNRSIGPQTCDDAIDHVRKLCEVAA